MSGALLLSGGIDSIAIAYWKRPQIAITIDYGQRPFAGELRASIAVCRALDLKHQTVTCNIAHLGSGDLSDRPPLSYAPVPEWWPFRNQFLATVAAMACAQHDVEELMFGTVSSDAQHADGSSPFIAQLNALMSLQEGHISVTAPAIALTSVELVEASGVPDELLAFSHSCHTEPVACAHCRGCLKHLEVIETLRARRAV
ncbi:MAG: 7-cyano-7-deazaguanine synthase [Vulcanimicrobiaceae bacterium]